MSNNYFVLAFYHFCSIDNPEEEVALHKTFLEERDVSSRIYISYQGINGQMSAGEKDAQEYMEWMHSRPLFKEVHFKIHLYHEHVFPRKTIKYRKNLVAFDHEVNLSKRGEYISPQKWKEMLEHSKNHILLDVRNDYEWKLGHFKGAELPACQTFREFNEYAENLEKQVDRKQTPVLMYCTGGIRCELYSAILKERGFEKVFQLQGGIINYGLEEGNKHWLGKLFVFDDRLSIPISHESSEMVGKCHHCHSPIDAYYNCANMDCNELFLCCPDCLIKFKGCCQNECQHTERVRPYHHQNPHKPFRKWYHYTNVLKRKRKDQNDQKDIK